MLEKINKAVTFLRSEGINEVHSAIVLGTGLGGLISHIKIIKEIDYKDIPNFVLSTVETHSGKLIYAEIKDKKVLVMQGRFHYYEGYTMQEITFPIKVIKLLGTKYLLLSNAAGAINLSFNTSSLMLIDDHINLQGDNPLRGKNINELGPRFPDMSRPYSSFLNEKIDKIAISLGIKLNKGVYAAVNGPNLETRAEYKYLKIIGADAVGMSTVPEVIVANHLNLPCAAVSVITDTCDPDNLKSVALSEIVHNASIAEPNLIKLFINLISEI